MPNAVLVVAAAGKLAAVDVTTEPIIATANLPGAAV